MYQPTQFQGALPDRQSTHIRYAEIVHANLKAVIDPFLIPQSTSQDLSAFNLEVAVGVRNDTGYTTGSRVSIHYDPLLDFG